MQGNPVNPIDADTVPNCIDTAEQYRTHEDVLREHGYSWILERIYASEGPIKAFIEAERELSKMRIDEEEAWNRWQMKKQVAWFLMVMFTLTFLLLLLHSAGLIQLPLGTLKCVNYSIIGEVGGLLGIVVHHLFGKGGDRR